MKSAMFQDKVHCLRQIIAAELLFVAIFYNNDSYLPVFVMERLVEKLFAVLLGIFPTLNKLFSYTHLFENIHKHIA